MLPILVLIAGIVLGHWLSTVIPVNKNILVGVLGLLGFSGTFVWLKKKGDSLSSRPGFVPEITSKQTPTQQLPPTDLACPAK
jgi:hypothetical protein